MSLGQYLSWAIPILGEYGAFGQIRGFEGKYNQIMVNKAKCG